VPQPDLQIAQRRGLLVEEVEREQPGAAVEAGQLGLGGDVGRAEADELRGGHPSTPLHVDEVELIGMAGLDPGVVVVDLDRLEQGCQPLGEPDRLMRAQEDAQVVDQFVRHDTLAGLVVPGDDHLLAGT
jgi:hypothetical protein